VTLTLHLVICIVHNLSSWAVHSQFARHCPRIHYHRCWGRSTRVRKDRRTLEWQLNDLRYPKTLTNIRQTNASRSVYLFVLSLLIGEINFSNIFRAIAATMLKDENLWCLNPFFSGHDEGYGSHAFPKNSISQRNLHNASGRRHNGDLQRLYRVYIGFIDRSSLAASFRKGFWQETRKLSAERIV